MGEEVLFLLIGLNLPLDLNLILILLPFCHQPESDPFDRFPWQCLGRLWLRSFRLNLDSVLVKRHGCAGQSLREKRVGHVVDIVLEISQYDGHVHLTHLAVAIDIGAAR